MADVRVAKQPPAPAAKRARQPKPQKVKEVVVPRPKPKPKPKKVQVQVEVKPEREVEHEYAELRPIRNSVHPYEPLSVETKETAPTDPPAVHLQVPEEPELHYANVSVHHEQLQAKGTKEQVLEDKEVNAKEKKSWTFFRKQCHFPHWKIVLSALCVAAVVFVLALILLVLAAVGLSRASKNTDRYQELDETAQQIAGQHLLLETTTKQLTQDIARLQKITDEMLLQNADRFEMLETTTEQIKQDNDNRQQKLENISQQIITLEIELDKSQMNASLTLENSIAQQEMVSRNISNRTTMLEMKTRQLDDSLATVNGTLRTLIDEVDTQVDGLKTEVETLLADTATLNETLVQLTKNGPFNCMSYIYQTVGAPNVTNINSPSYTLEPKSVSNLQ